MIFMWAFSNTHSDFHMEKTADTKIFVFLQCEIVFL